MKVYKQLVEKCDDCPMMKDSPTAGGRFCLLTKGGATKLKNDKPIPEWCPLEDEEEDQGWPDWAEGSRIGFEQNVCSCCRNRGEVCGVMDEDIDNCMKNKATGKA